MYGMGVVFVLYEQRVRLYSCVRVCVWLYMVEFKGAIGGRCSMRSQSYLPSCAVQILYNNDDDGSALVLNEYMERRCVALVLDKQYVRLNMKVLLVIDAV